MPVQFPQGFFERAAGPDVDFFPVEVSHVLQESLGVAQVAGFELHKDIRALVEGLAEKEFFRPFGRDVEIGGDEVDPALRKHLFLLGNGFSVDDFQLAA